MIGGASLALFTDETTNANNTFTTGSVKLVQERSSGDSYEGPMFYNGKTDSTGAFAYDQTNPYAPPGGEAIGGWTPGDCVIRSIGVKNKGTLDAKVTKIKAEINTNGEGAISGKEFDEFVKHMEITVKYSGQDKVLYKGSLSDLLDEYVNLSKPFILKAHGSTADLSFTAKLNRKTGNEVMGQTFVFNFTLYGEQLKNNP